MQKSAISQEFPSIPGNFPGNFFIPGKTCQKFGKSREIPGANPYWKQSRLNISGSWQECILHGLATLGKTAIARHSFELPKIRDQIWTDK